LEEAMHAKNVDLTGDIYALALARAACLVPEGLSPVEANRAHSRHARNIAALALRIPAEGEVDQLAEQPEQPADFTGIGTVASAALRAGARLLARKVRRDPIGAALALGGVALFAGGLLARKRPDMIEGPVPFDDGDLTIHPLEPCDCAGCSGGPIDDLAEFLPVQVARVVVLVPADDPNDPPAELAPAAIAQLVQMYRDDLDRRTDYAPVPVGMNVERDGDGAVYPDAVAWFVDEPPTDFPGVTPILLRDIDLGQYSGTNNPGREAVRSALDESDEHGGPILATYRLPASNAHLVVLAHKGNDLFKLAPKVNSHLASFIKPLDEPTGLVGEVIANTAAQPTLH
jgi:hypothetical protein